MSSSAGIHIIAIVMKDVCRGMGAGAPIPFCSRARKTEWDPQYGLLI